MPLLLAPGCRRRSVGISSLQSRSSHNAAFATLSSQISATQTESLKAQLETFRSTLREFAVKHREEIKKDPVFRMHFQRMCAHLDIDPLAGPLHPSSSGSLSSLFSTLLPLSDFTYALLTQIIDISLSTRALNGGLIPMPDLLRRIERRRGVEEGAIGVDDVRRAVGTMDPLGGGYEVVSLPGTKGSLALRCTTTALQSTDSSALIALALETGGRLAPGQVAAELGWAIDRVRSALRGDLVDSGVGWVDEQADTAEGWEVWVGGMVVWGD